MPWMHPKRCPQGGELRRGLALRQTRISVKHLEAENITWMWMCTFVMRTFQVRQFQDKIILCKLQYLPMLLMVKRHIDCVLTNLAHGPWHHLHACDWFCFAVPLRPTLFQSSAIPRSFELFDKLDLTLYCRVLLKSRSQLNSQLHEPTADWGVSVHSKGFRFETDEEVEQSLAKEIKRPVLGTAAAKSPEASAARLCPSDSQRCFSHEFGPF